MKLLLFLVLVISAAAQQTPATRRSPMAQGADQKEALKIADNIYQGIGFGNTFLVTTPEGNVIIDTSGPQRAPQHLRLLKQVSSAPVRYIILTHGHGDHTGGVALWTQPGTQIIAQREHVAFMNYQKRLEGFFAARNAAQFEFSAAHPGNGRATMVRRLSPRSSSMRNLNSNWAGSLSSSSTRRVKRRTT